MWANFDKVAIFIINSRYFKNISQSDLYCVLAKLHVGPTGGSLFGWLGFCPTVDFLSFNSGFLWACLYKASEEEVETERAVFCGRLRSAEQPLRV